MRARAALIPIWVPIVDSVTDGLAGKRDFDAKHYATVALQLCNSQHGAVTLPVRGYTTGATQEHVNETDLTRRACKVL